jgi:hypothetical protein
MTTTSSTPVSPWLVKNERTGQSLMQVLACRRSKIDQIGSLASSHWHLELPIFGVTLYHSNADSGGA